jgi:hypothetical protein
MTGTSDAQHFQALQRTERIEQDFVVLHNMQGFPSAVNQEVLTLDSKGWSTLSYMRWVIRPINGMAGFKFLAQSSDTPS